MITRSWTVVCDDCKQDLVVSGPDVGNKASLVRHLTGFGWSFPGKDWSFCPVCVYKPSAPVC